MTFTFGSVFAVSHLQHVTLPAPFPQSGRTYECRRTVRLGDVTPKGRLRLDATARYLQDIATDDSIDGNYDDPHGWVVRRTEMCVERFPKYLDTIRLTTWCGGVGSHWAERRTRIEIVADGVMQPAVEAAALWVRVDLQTLKPLSLTPRFLELIGEAANGRKVSARLLIGRDLPVGKAPSSSFDMPLRFADFDAVGHLNNAVYWEALEEYLAANREKRAPLHATVEHHASVEPGTGIHVHVHELGERTVLRLVARDATASLIQLVTA